MQHRWLVFLVIIFITTVVFLFASLHLRPVWVPHKDDNNQPTELTEKLSAPVITYVDPQKGASNPTVTIVEYSDFQCPACKELANNLDTALRTNPDIKIVWKDLPNESLHNLAVAAAVAARCAGEQGKFWEYHDFLFNNQTVLSEEGLSQMASSLGLSLDKFSQCYKGQDTLPLVKKDYDEGMALQITATPTLFIGVKRISGAISAEEILNTVKQQTAPTTTK